ncbi:MAG: family 10 glycosylhydrolase [Bacteroidota bacterium]
MWLSSASGDWPTSYNVEEQQRSLIEILDVLKKNNFNTLFFQVRPRGNALYRSDIELWALQLTGTLGKDPGWDPLQFAIDEARKRGMELHAWVNIAKVWGADSPPSRPEHVVNAHRDWVRQVENEWWIDMGNPAAREYTERVVMEIVQKYDIDGVHFDFIRYPSDSFSDWISFSTWSDGMERAEWRRNNITTFVRDCYQQIQSLKPWVKVGSAPVGIYQPINGAQSAFTGYGSVFQDSRRWLREGIHDYIVPQLYWSIGEQQNPNDPDFEALCYDWSRENYGRHVYAGIGIYRDNVKRETKEQVVASRVSGMLGQSYFRYEQLGNVLYQLGLVYRNTALIPSMPWKDSIPPLSPENVTIEFNGESSTIVRWSEPLVARDGEKPFRYAVYRSSTEPVDVNSSEHLIAVVPSVTRTYNDEGSRGSGKKYYYTVTSLDRCWNESSNRASVVDAGSLLARYSVQKSVPVLSNSIQSPTNGKVFISFELQRRDTIVLSVKHSATQEESVLVRGIKNPGIHIVAFDLNRFPPGIIEYTLRVQNAATTKRVEKK